MTTTQTPPAASLRLCPTACCGKSKQYIWDDQRPRVRRDRGSQAGSSPPASTAAVLYSRRAAQASGTTSHTSRGWASGPRSPLFILAWPPPGRRHCHSSTWVNLFGQRRCSDRIISHWHQPARASGTSAAAGRQHKDGMSLCRRPLSGLTGVT